MEKISIKEFQDIYIDEFSEFVDFLSKNNIKYSMAFGSLLGAVRESNIIPWDYDIDLYMTTSELKRLFEVLDKTKAFEYKTYLKSELSYGLSRIYCKRSFRQRYDEPEPSATFIDIFNVQPISGDYEDVVSKLRKLQEKRNYYQHIKYDNYIPKNPLKRLFRKLIPSRKMLFPHYNRILKQIPDGKDKLLVLYKEAVSEYDYREEYESAKFGKVNVTVFKNPVEIIEKRYGLNWRTPIDDHRSEAMSFFKE